MKNKYLLSTLSIAIFIAACSPKATSVKQDTVVTTASEKALPVELPPIILPLDKIIPDSILSETSGFITSTPFSAKEIPFLKFL